MGCTFDPEGCRTESCVEGGILSQDTCPNESHGIKRDLRGRSRGSVIGSAVISQGEVKIVRQ